MLQVLYISAFSILAFLAVSNLLRNMFILGVDSQRQNRSSSSPVGNRPVIVPHPECLTEEGEIINEPLLVVRSLSIEDARERLDALYHASPSVHSQESEED